MQHNADTIPSIREVRLAIGLTQQEAADYLELALGSFRTYEGSNPNGLQITKRYRRLIALALARYPVGVPAGLEWLDFAQAWKLVRALGPYGQQDAADFIGYDVMTVEAYDRAQYDPNGTVIFKPKKGRELVFLLAMAASDPAVPDLMDVAPEVLREPFQDELKAMRAAIGMTQAQAGAYLGWPASTIQSWEQGRRLPTDRVQRLIVLALKGSGGAVRAETEL